MASISAVNNVGLTTESNGLALGQVRQLEPCTGNCFTAGVLLLQLKLDEIRNLGLTDVFIILMLKLNTTSTLQLIL